MESSLCIYTARLLRMYRDIIREPDIYHKEGYTCSSFRERDLSPGCCPSHLSTPALPQHLDGCSFLLRLSGPTRPPPGERRERYARMSTLSSLHRPFFFYLRFFFFLASLLFFLFAFRLCIFASFSAENCLPAFLYFFFCTLSALCLLFCLPVGSMVGSLAAHMYSRLRRSKLAADRWRAIEIERARVVLRSEQRLCVQVQAGKEARRKAKGR